MTTNNNYGIFSSTKQEYGFNVASCWPGLGFTTRGNNDVTASLEATTPYSYGPSNESRANNNIIINNNNTTNTTATEIGEGVLANELRRLNFHYKQRIDEEIHGIVNVDDSDKSWEKEDQPGFIEQCLQQMQQEIDKLHVYDKTSYNEAYQLSPNLVMDHNFRLMFLRAEEFCPIKAARRITKHFDCKQRLFGKLVDDITLDKDIYTKTTTKELFLSGAFQTLPSKDQSGRTVCLFAPKHCKSQPGIDLVRYEKKAKKHACPPTIEILILPNSNGFLLVLFLCRSYE